LEPVGWARKNFSLLHVPVKQQSNFLDEAISSAVASNVNIRLFNYPLCLLSKEARKFAVKSISDWKNYFPNECGGCKLKRSCGGFFTSAVGRFIERPEVIYE